MHDIHIHTSLSSCAGADSTLADYAPAIRESGLIAAGFANHLWDSAVPGASEWYKPQDINHVLQLKNELSQYDFGPTRIYFGCETEYIGNGVVALHPDNVHLFDYVLVPPHHFHMAGFTRPADLADPRQLMIERFLEICDIDFAFGLVHPFYPMGYMDKAREVLQGISNAEFEKCYRYAAQKNKAIEINQCIFRYLPADALPEYKRMMTIARRCGCKFFLGSDSHSAKTFREGARKAVESFLKDCNIEPPENPLKDR